MLRNGSYSAWFRTRHQGATGAMQGEGTGVINLNDGKVTGEDTVLAYTGSYVEDGDSFTAFIATQRHTSGQPSVFGIDVIDLTVSGKSTPTTASCTGTAKQAPGLTFEATLIRIGDQPKALPPRADAPAFTGLNDHQPIPDLARRALKKISDPRRPVYLHWFGRLRAAHSFDCISARLTSASGTLRRSR